MPSPNRDRELQEKLEALLAQVRRRRESMEFDLNSLFDRLQPGSLAALALALGALVHEGKLKLVFRVMSPDGAGLGDFPTLSAIPPTMEDRFNDWRQFEVTPERVLPVYRFQ
jgi:hypothetical protein